MKTLTISLFILLSIIASSCASTSHFVVLRSVPNDPSITVVPPNENLTEVEFATAVESYVLSAGVRVIHRPPSKEALYAKKISQSEFQDSRPATEEVMTERYFPLEDAKSEYLFFTYAANRRVKLVKKSSGEVLSSVTLANAMGKDSQSESEIVVQNLRGAGLLKKPKNK